MARPKTELEQRCPSPPYTRWDQRVKPVLLSFLPLINGKHLCLSLETQDPDIARRHMRLLVGMLLYRGRLSRNSGAAKVYGRKGTRRSRLKKVDAEIRRLEALSDAEYGSEALAATKRWRIPVGLIYCLAERKPALSPGTYNTRRMRARERGRQLPLGKTWEHRPQGGKSYFLNGRVWTARLHIDTRTWQWPLKVRNEEEAEGLMARVRVTRQLLQRAAAEELNFELGTDAAVTAAVARAGARTQLASAIREAGGPRALVEFVLKGPQEEVGTAFSQPVVIRRPDRRAIKQAALKKCVQRYIELIQTYPDGPPEPRDVLAQMMMNDLRVTWHEARNCRREAIKRTKNLSWERHGRRVGDSRSKLVQKTAVTEKPANPL